MAASVNDVLQKQGVAGTLTTLSAPGHSVAGTTITVGSTTNWPIDTGITFAIRTVDASGNSVAGTYTEWRATVSGSTLTGMVLVYGTDQIYAAGSTTQVYIPVSAYSYNRMIDGLLVAHDQDGTLKTDAVDVTAVLADDVVTGAKIADDTVTNLNHQVAIRPVTLFDETTFDFVASGCVWSGDAYGSTRVASMTAGVVYINGNRVAVSAVTSRTFTASRDTYIDVGTDGVVDYSESTNNAASQALAADHIRIGIIVTGASNIAAVGSVNQGQEDKVLPIASSIPYAVTDSLGNLICNRSPNSSLLGYRQIVASLGYGTGNNQIVGLSSPVNFPTSMIGRKYKVNLVSAEIYNSGANLARVSIWDGAVGGGTQIAQGEVDSYAGTAGAPVNVERLLTCTAAGLKTFNAGMLAGAGTSTIYAASTAPAYLKVELV